jgi:penicillin-binding protein 1A
MDQDQGSSRGDGWRGMHRRSVDAAGSRLWGMHARLMARPLWQRFVLVGLWGGAALLLALLLWILILIPLTPGISDLRQARAAQPTVIVGADGRELTSFEEGVHEHVPLNKISPHVIKALVATEDHRFYEHSGIDFRRTVAALVYSAGGDRQGGSTLTQQLARNMFPKEIGRSRNISRKLKEIVTAIKIESAMSKDEILEAYLNTVPFLYNAFGIEAAARTYFGKPAAKLDILESATLVGMLKGTNYYNPVSNPKRSLERRNVVLGQLMRRGEISKERFDALKKRPLRLRFERQLEKNGKDSDNHFTAYVRKWLIEWADENDYNLQRDGLVVHTTLDPELQAAAQKAVARQAETLQAIADVEWSEPSVWSSSSTSDYTDMRSYVKPFDYFWRSRGGLLDAFIRESDSYRKAVEAGEDPKDAVRRLRADRDFMASLRAAKTRLEAGFVALDPRTGEVKAWVGSRDFRRDQFDHVAQAERQPGSTFKPIVYAAALEKGLTPDHEYRDAVLDIHAGDGTVWRPTDMEGTTGRMVPMRDGLVYSKNTVTAQVMQDVGVGGIVSLAQGLGIRERKLDRVPSLALGTSPVTLLEMVNVYASIASQGQYRKPVFVRRITDRAGNVIATFGNGAPEQVMSQASAVTLIDMMRGVVNRGTGTAVRFRFGIYGDVAGKTGTTQRNADGWFILMHPQLVGGAWVGFNDNRVTMRSNYWGQGGHNAIRLVGDFFKTALDAKKIDQRAVFPGGRPPPPPRPRVVEDEEPEVIYEDPGEIQTEEGVPTDPYQNDPLPDPEEVDVEEINEPIEESAPPPARPIQESQSIDDR